MSETKVITTLYVVTDTENSYDKIGDIDGGLFDQVWLEKYIASHGTERLLEKLASMQSQIISTKWKIEQKFIYDAVMRGEGVPKPEPSIPPPPPPPPPRLIKEGKRPPKAPIN